MRGMDARTGHNIFEVGGATVKLSRIQRDLFDLRRGETVDNWLRAKSSSLRSLSLTMRSLLIVIVIHVRARAMRGRVRV